MRKYAFSLLLVLVMVFGLLPMTAQAEKLDNGLKYEVYSDHVEITNYTGDATEVVIPAEIEGLPVTFIGDKAFYYLSGLTSVTMPDSLTSIGEEAFRGCTNLTSITMSDSLTSIGGWAFYECSSLVSIDLPDSLISIGARAFTYCSSLVSIVIPGNVTSIGDDAFRDCTSLTGIHVDEKNLYYSSDDRGVLFDKDKTALIQAPCTISGSYVIPAAVTSIVDSAFSYCNSLTSIDIPDSVSFIDEFAFYACSSLTSIDLPDDITEIGWCTFYDCASLISVDLPNSLTYIDESAFAACDSLTSINFPASLTYIGDWAFEDCDNLTSIYFNGDVPKFGLGVFYGVTATANYPSGNPTWTDYVTGDRIVNYGSTITWVPYDPFTDVDSGSFYYDPVLWAVENGITTGATADSFNPTGTCLRAQVVTFLHRADGNPEPTSSKNPFTDVKSSDFFYKPVLWAVDNGITNGVNATTFGSYANCNRAAVVTFLWRAAGSPEPESTSNPFVDVKTTDFFYKPVLWAVENGITNGVDATHFGPAADCNRSQVVTFLYRAFSEQ